MVWEFLKSKKEEDKLKEDFHLQLTKEEKEFVVNQSKEECTSQNSLIRKCIKHYRKSLSFEVK